MKKILCLGEVASHHWTELMVKEGFITHSFDTRPCGFDVSSTFDFSSSHRIYDKKHLLFLMVLFEETMTSSIVNFPLDKVANTGLIDEEKFHLFKRVDKYNEFANTGIKYFTDISLDFMANNKKSMVNYLSKDILHTSYFEVNAAVDYDSFFRNPLGTGPQSGFNPNVFILREIRDALALGLKLSQTEEICFYNGRLSHINKKHNFKDVPDLNSFSDNIRYILQLDLTPQINEFPIPESIRDVLYLRKQPEIISFREVFFDWLTCLQEGDYDIANKIKCDVVKANEALAKYKKWEKRKTNMLYCTLDAVVGLIPYISTVVGSVTPYSLRKTLKDKNNNSWVNLLK
ncbi:MAG: hypothetical protein FWE56_03545 [Candidatus Bathyarchaeota archaeon]|nr:hypothetical protein [Candidatus Termiticorpusculum sp.]MCL2868599.1 hypothetical protein [Candidatus Termiticorpusculum sp.]